MGTAGHSESPTGTVGCSEKPHTGTVGRSERSNGIGRTFELGGQRGINTEHTCEGRLK
jgi:hypothetical protein